VSPDQVRGLVQPRVPGLGSLLLQLCPPTGQAPELPCLRTRGMLLCSRVLPNLAACYFNFVLQQGRHPRGHVSPDPGRAPAQPCLHRPNGQLLICLHPPVRLAPKPPQDKVDSVTEDDDGHTKVVKSPPDPHCTSTIARHLTMYT
jgi:hypothetical protein